jgi:nicotinamidase/pyrazinamidase
MAGNDFVLPGAPLEVPAARRIVPAIRLRIEEARKTGVPVIYLCDAHDPDDREFKIWPPHAVRGTKGAEVIAELAPHPGDIIVPKTAYSAFYGTTLESVLRGLGVKEITMVGIFTNICVLYTSADALMRGFAVTVPKDSVAALSDEEHAFALDQMEKVLKVRLV